MDLWIRDQFKTSIKKVDNIFYSYLGRLHKIATNIETATIPIILGVYDSRERAMEILDEIQEILLTKTTCSSVYEERNMVYEMPKE